MLCDSLIASRAESIASVLEDAIAVLRLASNITEAIVE